MKISAASGLRAGLGIRAETAGWTHRAVREEKWEQRKVISELLCLCCSEMERRQNQESDRRRK